jgi:hypothetical protein
MVGLESFPLTKKARPEQIEDGPLLPHHDLPRRGSIRTGRIINRAVASAGQYGNLQFIRLQPVRMVFRKMWSVLGFFERIPPIEKTLQTKYFTQSKP